MDLNCHVGDARPVCLTRAISKLLWTGVFWIALLASMGACANPLSHSKWMVGGEGACADYMYFGERQYLYLNACHVRGKDGVIERGRYALTGSILRLSDRASTAPEGYEYIPGDVTEFRIVALTGERLVLRAGN